VSSQPGDKGETAASGSAWVHQPVLADRGRRANRTCCLAWCHHPSRGDAQETRATSMYHHAAIQVPCSGWRWSPVYITSEMRATVSIWAWPGLRQARLITLGNASADGTTNGMGRRFGRHDLRSDASTISCESALPTISMRATCSGSRQGALLVGHSEPARGRSNCE
jgi:hypothetical protein